MHKILSFLLLFYFFGCNSNAVPLLVFDCMLQDGLQAVTVANAIKHPLHPYGKETAVINGTTVEQEWQQFQTPLNTVHFSILTDWKPIQQKGVPFLLKPATDNTDSYFGLVTNPKGAAVPSFDDYIGALVKEAIADTSITITEMVRYVNEVRGLYYIELSNADDEAVYFSVVTESPSCILDFTMKSTGDYVMDKAHYLNIVSSLTVGGQSVFAVETEVEVVNFGIED